MPTLGLGYPLMSSGNPYSLMDPNYFQGLGGMGSQQPMQQPFPPGGMGFNPADMDRIRADNAARGVTFPTWGTGAPGQQPPWGSPNAAGDRAWLQPNTPGQQPPQATWPYQGGMGGQVPQSRPQLQTWPQQNMPVQQSPPGFSPGPLGPGIQGQVSQRNSISQMDPNNPMFALLGGMQQQGRNEVSIPSGNSISYRQAPGAGSPGSWPGQVGPPPGGPVQGVPGQQQPMWPWQVNPFVPQEPFQPMPPQGGPRRIAPQTPQFPGGPRRAVPSNPIGTPGGLPGGNMPVPRRPGVSVPRMPSPPIIDTGGMPGGNMPNPRGVVGGFPGGNMPNPRGLSVPRGGVIRPGRPGKYSATEITRRAGR